MKSNRFKLERDCSLFGRLLGRTWIVDRGAKAEPGAARQTRTRFTDLEGNAPSLRSVAKLHVSAWTKLLFRKQLLMSEPLPWLVYDAISFLEELVEPECRVLEVGGGNSTIWFLQRGARVTSIESDAAWTEAIQFRVRNDPRIESPSRHNLVNRLGAEAIEFIRTLPDQKFDIILIDSIPERIPRGPALQAARPKLKPGGFMILDNSDSPAHRDAVAAMSDRKLLRFSGFTPMRLHVSQTSFWQV